MPDLSHPRPRLMLATGLVSSPACCRLRSINSRRASRRAIGVILWHRDLPLGCGTFTELASSPLFVREPRQIGRNRKIRAGSIYSRTSDFPYLKAHGRESSALLLQCSAKIEANLER